MYLVVTATDSEMLHLRAALANVEAVAFLVTGMGLVETALGLTRYLEGRRRSRPEAAALRGVINFGVAGAFVGSGLELVDLCLADRDILGDLGVCDNDGITGFDVKGLPVRREFPLNNRLLAEADNFFMQNGISCKKGGFVTVNCASGTRGRGDYLRDRYRAICENMEGAAVARVCEEYGLPCLELRCISNWVEDRPSTGWRLEDACEKGGRSTALLLAHLCANM